MNNVKYIDNRDMVFKDIQTAIDFLTDLGNKLPNMFEFTPPKCKTEYIRAIEGGKTIVLYKDKKMGIEEEMLTVSMCEKFCSMIGKHTVYEVMG